MGKKHNIAPLILESSKIPHDSDVHVCDDCHRIIHGDYQFAMHRAFKHDDWSLLEEYQRKTGKAIGWAR